MKIKYISTKPLEITQFSLIFKQIPNEKQIQSFIPNYDFYEFTPK